MAIGINNTTPAAKVTIPGAINSNATSAIQYRCTIATGAMKYPENAIPRDAMPIMAPKSVIKNRYQVNPSTTKSNAGEKTKTNGTSAFAMPRRKAVFPVLNGFDPAILAAA